MVAAAGGTFVEPSDVRELADGMTLEIAGLNLSIAHAPGHTAGCITYTETSAVAPVMFSGDVLFRGAIGRTDLPGGSSELMIDSLSRVILGAKDETIVHCGHGPSTEIGIERATNPYLQNLVASSQV